MGDRTYVQLYIPTELADLARPIIEENDAPEDETSDDTLTCFGISEVNYATLECEGELREAGIPYTKRWEAGGEYDAGEEHLRFTSAGEAVYLEVFDEDKGVPLEALERALSSPFSMQAVRELAADHRARTVPMPWGNQVEYGRRYVAAQEQQK